MTSEIAPHFFSSTVGFHLSGLSGKTSHPDKQKIQIIGFLFENMLHWQFEVGGGDLQTALLGYIFIYIQIKH